MSSTAAETMPMNHMNIGSAHKYERVVILNTGYIPPIYSVKNLWLKSFHRKVKTTYTNLPRDRGMSFISMQERCSTHELTCVYSPKSENNSH